MFTTINGIDICYDDTGAANAPAIIFIHGFPLNREMWRAQMQHLAGRCRTIAYDLRGHGESGLGDEAFTIELFVNDLIHFMDALRIEKATLCAHSMGGYVALNAIEAYPKRFNALILCNTRCGADSDEAKAIRTEAIKGIKRDGVETFAELLIGKMLAPGTFESHHDVVDKLKAMALTISETSLERSMLAMREREDTCSKLPQIQVPTLVIAGEADKIIRASSTRYLKENIPHAHLDNIPETGHMSNLENPEAFNAALEKFVKASVCR